MDDGEEPVQRHEDERENGGVSGDDDEILDRAAPEIAERPEREDVIGGREGDAEDDEEEIRHGQIDYENVRRRAHLRVGGDDNDDERVAYEAEDDYDAEQYRHDDRHQLFHEEDLVRVRDVGRRQRRVRRRRGRRRRTVRHRPLREAD